MPMRINLKFPELPPAAVATIAGGVQRLAAVEEALRPHEDEEEAASVLAACSALRQCIAFAQRTESSARGMLANAREQVETAADLAASNVRSDGFPGPGMYNAAVERARSEVVERFGAAAWEKVLESEQAMADKLAAVAATKMRVAKKAVEIANARQAGPAALREKTSADDLYTLGAIKEEEATKRPSEWLPTYEALIESGDEKGERAYVVAVKLLAQEVVSMPHTKLRERIGAMGPDTPERRESVERERAAALRFLDRVHERAAELVPESLRLATLALAELQGCYAAIVGYHAMVVPRDAFDRRRQSGRADPLDVSGGWTMRLGLATAKAKR